LLRPTDQRFAIALTALSSPSQSLPACAFGVGYVRTFVFANTTTDAYLVWLPTDPCSKPLSTLP
jgi:hypothetical protein